MSRCQRDAALSSGVRHQPGCLSCSFGLCPAEDKDETVARTYLSELKNIRLRLEECEQRLVSRIQSPSSTRADGDTIQENTIRIVEQEVSPAAGMCGGGGCWFLACAENSFSCPGV